MESELSQQNHQVWLNRVNLEEFSVIADKEPKDKTYVKEFEKIKLDLLNSPNPPIHVYEFYREFLISSFPKCCHYYKVLEAKRHFDFCLDACSAENNEYGSIFRSGSFQILSVPSWKNLSSDRIFVQ